MNRDQAGIPFFESAEGAMRTYALVFRYQRRRQEDAALRQRITHSC
jgi:hypothetical protein